MNCWRRCRVSTTRQRSPRFGWSTGAEIDSELTTSGKSCCPTMAVRREVATHALVGRDEAADVVEALLSHEFVGAVPEIFDTALRNAIVDIETTDAA
jgi:hypothetical protein